MRSGSSAAHAVFKATYASEDLSLFPTEVKILRWRTEPGFNERLSRVCESLQQRVLAESLAFDEYNLWHEDASEICALKEMFVRGMTAYIENHCKPETMLDFDYEMHAWLRIDKPKQIQAPHTHPLANLIATYYCQADIADRRVESIGYGKATLVEGDLVVRDPRPGNQRKFSNADNEVSISPEPGIMVIMPNFLLHWVNPVSSGDVRICIANNLNFRKKVPIAVSGSFGSK